MSYNDRGSQSWTDLTESEQLSMLTAYVIRNRAKLLRRYPNVLALGVGYKTKGGEVRPSLCIGFLVERKSQDVSPAIPAFVSGFTRQIRKRKIAIPTDIEEIGDGSQNYLPVSNLATGVMVRSTEFPSKLIQGAICCLVSLKNENDVFALSCYHVLSMSLLHTGAVGTDKKILVDSQGKNIGRFHEGSQRFAGNVNYIDVALARIVPPMKVEWKHDIVPNSVNMGVSKPENCAVYTGHGALPAIFVKTWVRVKLQYGSSTVEVPAAYEFISSAGPGDSGSPVMDIEGVLYGMHFWGRAGGFTLSVPAGYLFSATTFKKSKINALVV